MQNTLPRFGDRRHTRIGLLGGSFNPAHAGHRQVALQARRRLRLHQVWLLVSPGNPLKPKRGMASLPDRLASARRIADGRRVVATDIESRWGTRYSVDTLRLLRTRFPCARFVWLTGADILAELPRWRRWQRLTGMVPLAVLPRQPYTARALHGRAASVLRHRRLPAGQASRLVMAKPPAWLYLPMRLNPLSSTALRRAGAPQGSPQAQQGTEP